MSWFGSSPTCGRRVYWVGVGVLCLAPIFAKAVGVDPLLAAGLWIILYRLRLRDCGRAQWWVLALILAEILPFVVAGLLGGDPFVYAIGHQGLDPDGRPSMLIQSAVGVALVMQFGFTVWLGSLKGRREAPLQGEATGGQLSIWEARTWEEDEPRAPPITLAPPPGDYGPLPLANRDGRPAFGRRSTV